MGLSCVKPRLRSARVSGLPSIKPADSWRGNKSSAERGYGHRWRQARRLFLIAHPLCVYCAKQGKTTAANVVDHIVPHRGDESLMWDESNWQALCTHCHSSLKQCEEKASRG